MYSGLKYLYYENFGPGKIHQLLKMTVRSYRDVTRFPVKLRMLTGTYILQSIRIKFDHALKSDQCPACTITNESLEHVLLHCPSWESTRQLVIILISKLLAEKYIVKWHELQTNMQMQIVLDITNVSKQLKIKLEDASEIEFQTRYLLHVERCKLMDGKPVVKKPPLPDVGF